ncbi:hypothetical protein D3C72_2561090 [compost metagenome]
MVSEQDGALVTDRLGDDLAFFIAHRHTWPILEKGAIVEQRANVHMGDGERHFQHRQRGAM